MPFVQTGFAGLLIFEPAVFEDSRGYFFESYNENVFREADIDIRFVQDNQARSSYGVLRGMHYQRPPYAQTKLVRVLEGAIWDVVADLRRSSPTFGQVYGLELSAENKKQLLVPAGFAHGYAVLSPTAEVFYKCDHFYQKASEGGIRYDDPDLQIDWKIDLSRAVISEKDLQLPAFRGLPEEF
ncbi:dTDP-4-dehydrorhamnose 3,5-epimerase [Compostibacter hankyongensis]|uniref:dTDP-4-dehydrorhamnose 3,5-epimerase n=1 Tax=Compostibacter hankyongensis TaxID=1007089 RepID=A0ABP8FHI6_9BACT